MSLLTIFHRHRRGPTRLERQLARRVHDLAGEVADVRRQLAVSQANVEASKLAYAVKQVECDKLAAVCARDLMRVQAETAELARHKASTDRK